MWQRCVHITPHKVFAHSWQERKVRNDVLYALPNLASHHIKEVRMKTQMRTKKLKLKSVVVHLPLRPHLV